MEAARTIVVGGHTRNIGKTALVVDLIRAFPQAGWTAVKITQYGHGICSINGEHCGCSAGEHAYSITEETDRSEGSDSSRFLAAGAQRALWVRTKMGRLAEALPALRQSLREGRNVIIESNSLLRFLRPDLYLVVLDPGKEDFKESARRNLDLADGFVLRAQWPKDGMPAVPDSLLGTKPRFAQALGDPLPPELARMVHTRLDL